MGEEGWGWGTGYGVHIYMGGGSWPHIWVTKETYNLVACWGSSLPEIICVYGSLMSPTHLAMPQVGQRSRGVQHTSPSVLPSVRLYSVISACERLKKTLWSHLDQSITN